MRRKYSTPDIERTSEVDAVNGNKVSILWKLEDIMYRLNITNAELGLAMDKSSSGITKLKKNRTMPRLNAKYLSCLLESINTIRERKLRDQEYDFFEHDLFSKRVELQDLISTFESS